MARKLQLQVPTPCHENWENMTPTEKGRFCACRKPITKTKVSPSGDSALKRIDLQQTWAFCLQLPIKQGFNTEAGTVFALRLSISYFYIYLNA